MTLLKLLYFLKLFAENVFLGLQDKNHVGLQAMHNGVVVDLVTRGDNAALLDKNNVELQADNNGTVGPISAEA